MKQRDSLISWTGGADPERLRSACVIFHDESALTGAPWWYEWWLKRFSPVGFRHVETLIWTGGGWITVNTGPCWSDVAHIPWNPRLPLLTKAVLPEATVMEVNRVREKRFYPRGILTCVSYTKMLLGIRAWWVITPHQLFRYLEREGHHIVGG